MHAIYFTLVAAITAAAAPINDFVIHERRLSNIARGARLDAEAIIPLRIALKQQQVENSYEHLMSVSSPSSARYGRHWTSEEVDRINESRIHHSDNQVWLAVNLPARELEILIRAEYHEYETDKKGNVRVGCDSYSLPMRVSEHVDLIKPAVALSPLMQKVKIGTRNVARLSQMSAQIIHKGPGHVPLFNNGSVELVREECSPRTTPACLRALYSIPRLNSSGLHNGLGVYEAGGAYSQADLDRYFETFASDIPQGTQPTLASINGGEAPVPQNETQGESVIDLDIMLSISYPQPVTLYQVKGYAGSGSGDESFLSSFLEAIDGSFCTPLDRTSGHQCGTDSLTKVVSVSYVALELGFSALAQRRACHEIMKLGLRGHTVVFASGDHGVAGFPKSSNGYRGCVTPSLDANGPENGNIFNPTFPSNCPYVLSVGATQLNTTHAAPNTEGVMSVPTKSGAFSSAGGFSNYFTRPMYQEDAVRRYLSSYAPDYPSYSYALDSNRSQQSAIGANGGNFNRAGRGYPDVSANGAVMATFIRGRRSNVLGTSLAAPIWASMIAMLNDERMNMGKGAVGFVNPVLYEHPEVFHDISEGTNPGCGTAGFPASPGWDPSSGLGTPNYAALRGLFLRLP